jgi:hypothetical protein
MALSTTDYRRKADEADEWASETSDPIVAARCRELAKQWRRIADGRDRTDALIVDVILPAPLSKLN